MSFLDIIEIAVMAVKATHRIASVVKNSDVYNNELKRIVSLMATDLELVDGTLNHLQNIADRVSVDDERILKDSIEKLRIFLDDAQELLEDMARDRNFLERLSMKTNDYKRKADGASRHLHTLCQTVLQRIQAVQQLKVTNQPIPDFRQKLAKVSEKTLYLYDFSIKRYDQYQPVKPINEDFSSLRFPFYMKICDEKMMLSYDLRTWLASSPKSITLSERLKSFQRNWSLVNNYERPKSSLGFSLLDTATSLPSTLDEKLKIIDYSIDFSEFYMYHDCICGMAVTESFLYIATKHDIIIVALNTKTTVVHPHGHNGASNQFNTISYLYIPPHDKTSLYIVDSGNHCVYKYKIDDRTPLFQYVRRYTVIANVNQRHNLVSCVIYDHKLYVSDSANNCLHIFPIEGERQSLCLIDLTLALFSPGLLCTHDKYLYVVNRLPKNLGILIFNELHEIVDRFYHSSITDILSMDIDPNINALYMLVLTPDQNNFNIKRPMIASMDIIIDQQN